MPITLIKLIYNMINNRKFRVTVGKHNSKRVFKITKGLQQGMVNSPELFNMYRATSKMVRPNSERGINTQLLLQMILLNILLLITLKP